MVRLNFIILTQSNHKCQWVTGYEALSVMKQLRHCGVPLTAKLYLQLLSCLSHYSGHNYEGQKSPLQVFSSLRVDITAKYLLQEIKNDGISLDGQLISSFVALYKYAAQWHLSNTDVSSVLKKSIGVGGNSASRDIVTQATKLLEELCSSTNTNFDENMAASLISVCCAGKHSDMAVEILALVGKTSNQETASWRVGLQQVTPCSGIYEPIFMSLHEYSSLDGLLLAKSTLGMMKESKVPPSPAMLSKVLNLLENYDDAAAAVNEIPVIISLAGGVKPTRKSVFQLLNAILDRRAERHSNVEKLLGVIAEFYSPENVNENSECIYYEDLEEIFRMKNVNIDEYDV